MNHIKVSPISMSMVYPRGERVLIFDKYLSSNFFVAVRGAISNSCPDKEVPNKTKIHRLITKFRDRRGDCVLSRRWQRFLASAFKLFCKSSQQNENYRITRLYCYIYDIKSYKYCCSYSCALNETPCITDSEFLLFALNRPWLIPPKRW